MNDQEKKEFIQIFNEGLEKLILPEITEIKTDVKTLRVDVSELNSGVTEIKGALKTHKQEFRSFVTSFDRHIKIVESLQQEYLALQSKVSRHEKWISEIAEKVGIKLET